MEVGEPQTARHRVTILSVPHLLGPEIKITTDDITNRYGSMGSSRGGHTLLAWQSLSGLNVVPAKPKVVAVKSNGVEVISDTA